MTWLTLLARQLQERPQSRSRPGRAEDRGLVINTFGGSLDEQLQALAQSHLADYDLTHPSKGLRRTPGRTGQCSRNGRRTRSETSEADLIAKAHLWIEGMIKPRRCSWTVVYPLRGPLSGGSGDLSLLQVRCPCWRYQHLFRLSFSGALDFAAVTTSAEMLCWSLI